MKSVSGWCKEDKIDFLWETSWKENKGIYIYKAGTKNVQVISIAQKPNFRFSFHNLQVWLWKKRWTFLLLLIHLSKIPKTILIQWRLGTFRCYLMDIITNKRYWEVMKITNSNLTSLSFWYLVILSGFCEHCNDNEDDVNTKGKEMTEGKK